MSVGQVGPIPPSAPSSAASRAERRFRLLAAGLGLAFAAYAAATLLPTPSAALSVARNLFVLPIPVLACWAYARAPARLRRPLGLFAVAAVVWVAGSFVWYGEFFAASGRVPEPPGPADAFFLTARLVIVVGLVIALKSVVSIRIAALDACVIVAASVAVGSVFVQRGVDEGFSASTLVTLNGPILGTLTLMLIVSGALGSWHGVPRSFALLGLGMAAVTAGSLIYSFQAVQHAYLDDRWAGLAWAGGAVPILLSSSVIILGLDRPVGLSSRAAIPNQPPGSGSVLLLSLGALALTLGVALYGEVAGVRPIALIGVAASVAIGIAMALRAREGIRTAEEAYARLDRALSESERARDELAAANEDLARANTELRVMHTAFADLLNLADERSSGRMRELIEDTGDELAKLLEEELEEKRRP